MPLSPIEEASLLNNEGARIYAEGNLVEAMSRFRSSLQKAIQAFNDQMAAPGVAASPKLVAAQPVTGTDRSGEDPLLFANPIVFEEVVGETQEAQLIFCGVVVFNMAITSHARNNGARNLVRALGLYDSSIGFFRRTNNQGAFFASVIAAALNNKMQIYFMKSQFEELERDSEQLKQAMVLAGQNIATKSILMDNEFEGILLNILLLRRPALAEAA